MKTLLYTGALSISVMLVGYLAFFAILPIAFITLMIQHLNNEEATDE